MKVLVVDRHPAMRLGLRSLLGATGDMRVVGETGDGCEALNLAEDLEPRLVILGLNLPGKTDGVEVCWRLKALRKPPRVLVHASCNSAGDVSSCLLVGADGYVHKDAGCEELLTIVRRTAAGERVWHPEDGGRHTRAVTTSACFTEREGDPAPHTPWLL